MVEEVFNPHTGKFSYYKIKETKLSRKEIEQLFIEIKLIFDKDKRIPPLNRLIRCIRGIK